MRIGPTVIERHEDCGLKRREQAAHSSIIEPVIVNTEMSGVDIHGPLKVELTPAAADLVLDEQERGQVDLQAPSSAVRSEVPNARGSRWPERARSAWRRARVASSWRCD